MTNQNPVKAIVEDREGAYNLFWNGKVYGTKVYASLSRRDGRGSDKKISFDMSTNRADAGTSDISTAKRAFSKLAEMGIAPFAQFDFSDAQSSYAYAK